MPFEPHHGPTKGGSQESEKFNEWYSKTLESYKNVFGMNPPVNIWPDPTVGFVMINPGSGLIPHSISYYLSQQDFLCS